MTYLWKKNLIICQNGIYNHFRAIADSTPLPIMLYNIPGRTGINMSAETVKKCSEIPNIIALKESAGSVKQMEEFKSIYEIRSGIVHSGLHQTGSKASKASEGARDLAGRVLRKELDIAAG